MGRGTKFYRKNENKVMELLGLKPTKNSGAGWIEKADGQSEKLISELKSTDKNSIKLNLQDIERLEYHSNVSNKLPIFAVQFLKNIDDIDMGTYLLVRPSDLLQVAEYISNPYKPITKNIEINTEGSGASEDNKIVSTTKAKEQWKKAQEEKYKNYKRRK